MTSSLKLIFKKLTDAKQDHRHEVHDRNLTKNMLMIIWNVAIWPKQIYIY
jgi:hypothetical protein